MRIGITNLMMGLLVIFTGCSFTERTPKSTLVVGLDSPPTTLDPRMATDANSQRISDLIFSALLHYGKNLQPEPEAAERWEVTDKQITFFIKPGLTFHNGRTVNAEDVIFSFNEYRKPESPFASALASIKEVRSPEALKVVLELKENDASLIPNLPQIKILPKEGLDGRNPLGSGPYRFISQDNNQLELKKFEGASHTKTHMEKILFKYVRDENTRYLKIVKGDLDVLLNDLTEEKVKDLQKSGKAQVLISPGLNFNYILINLKDPRLRNIELRRALYSAIDRDEIIKYKLEGLAYPADSILAPANPFHAEKLNFTLLPFDKASAVIRKLKMEGSEISLKTSNEGQAKARILAQQLEKLGIKIKLETLEWGTFYTDVKSGRYTLATMRWVGIVDPDVYRDTLSSNEFPPGRNRGYYSNKEFDVLVTKARREIDFKQRQELFRKAQQLVADDLPILPLWYNANISVLGKRVRNFTPSMTGSFLPFTEVEKEE